tara:strand:+ start:194 stop:493 length:300 start_codon:yes stop_codon:yes gene_type:complete
VQKIKDINGLINEGKRLSILSHPLRLKILDYIRINQPVYVSQIYKELNLEQSVTSNQLGYLRKAGVLNTTRDGKKIFYSLNKSKLEQILDNIRNYFTKQ